MRLYKEVKVLFDTLSIGKVAMLLSMTSDSDEEKVRNKAEAQGYKVFKGHVGAMDSSKIFASIETAAKREKFIKNIYREEHSLYHAVLEAYEGICRGQIGLGNVMRTAGLVFAIVKGSRLPRDSADGQWIAIVLYGNMGAPIKGYEHEVIGLGIYPV